MENKKEFENESYFNNTTTILETLSLRERTEFLKEDDRVISLRIYEIKRALPRAKSELENFCISEQEQIKSGYEYLSDKINEINELFNDNEFSYKDERIKWLKRLKEEIDEVFLPKIAIEISTEKRLKWLGTPAQFGFIIQELIGKGYLERPTSTYAKDASLYLSIFDIKTKPGTLEKEISSGENQNSLSSGNRVLFKIPPISNLR